MFECQFFDGIAKTMINGTWMNVSNNILWPGASRPGRLDGKGQACLIDDDIRAVYLNFESTPRFRVATDMWSEKVAYGEGRD